MGDRAGQEELTGMLNETFPVKLEDEVPRRWFSDDYFDLIIWTLPNGSVSGFQLCYDKTGTERALTWSPRSGFQHERVDTGEADPTKNRTPVLVPDGLCPIREI